MQLGRNILEKALLALDGRMSELPQESIDRALLRFNAQSLDQLSMDVALGNLLPQVVAAELQKSTGIMTQTTLRLSQFAVLRVLLSFARCCCPAGRPDWRLSQS